MYDVITVGSNTVDVFAKTDSELVEIVKKDSVEDLLAYPLGSKILIKEIEFTTGGGGTNTAVSFARLGLKTGYLGKIGKDENGLKIFSMLKQEKIDFLGKLGKVTGLSVILDSIKEDRTVLTYKGCNNDLTFKELPLYKIKAEWFYFSSMMGKSFEALKSLAEYAGKKKIKVAFNASSYLAEKGTAYLKKVLDNTTVFILNKEEAQLLAGKGDIKTLSKKLKAKKMAAVVITDGANGAYCYDGIMLYQVKPARNLKIKETTGAGDAFASTFIAGMMYNRPIEECLKMAAINSESVIQHFGAKNLLLTKSQLNRKMLKDRRKIIKSKI